VSISKHRDPETDHPLEPTKLHFNVEKDESGTMWPWIAGTIAVIVVVTLVYGYTKKIWATVATSPASSPSEPPKPRSVARLGISRILFEH
jgi:hypothetical protein